MTYETVKTVHLLGAVILFGTGLGTAFQMWRADRGGDDAGRRCSRTWTLIAGAGDGPWIPCMPAIILARRLAAGNLGWTGARPCYDLFPLEAFADAVRDLDIAFEET